MDDERWKLTYVEFDDGRAPYETFLRAMDPYRREVVLQAVQHILARQGTNVCSSEWGSALGGGLYEFRIRRALSTICHEAGIRVPAGLAGGYDKGDDPSTKRQQREIAAARKVLAEYKRLAAAKVARATWGR